jgi:uncharacterized protein YndB with AHSA1/START domain
MAPSTTDRIEKEIVLRAARSRVWRALTDVKEFSSWFRVNLESAFAPGQRTRGQITYPGYEHLTLEVLVERMDAEELFSFHWHPYPDNPKGDLNAEPMTRVEFHLEDVPGGTRLKVTESGFDRLPAERRDEAFRMNEGGWTQQLTNIERHVSG